MEISEAPPQETKTRGRSVVAIQEYAYSETISVAMWRGPLQICQAVTALCVPTIWSHAA